MTGPFEIVGDDDAPVCVDGVCEIPRASDGAPEEQAEPGL